MAHLAMIPVDSHAKDGAYHLCEATDGTRHSAAWQGDHWAYAPGLPVQHPIINYCARLPGARLEHRA